jgi:hypothetical protein
MCVANSTCIATGFTRTGCAVATAERIFPNHGSIGTEGTAAVAGQMGSA